MMTASEELRAALMGLAKLHEPARQAMAEMAKSLEPTRKLFEQMRVNLPVPTVTKEFRDQMAAVTAAFKNMPDLAAFKMPELKPLFDQSNALKISDAIRIPRMITRIH